MALLCLLNWLFLLHLVSGIKETTVDLIESQGYPAEVHFVTTNDGYILTVHRIPRPGAPVVFYQHGYESSSADMVLGPSNTTLGFLMSDQGFDVWMGNFRGNVYSKNHTSLNPNTIIGPFWDFTWWENGAMDIPAMLNYILETTSQEKLQVVVNGMGATALFVTLDQHPDISDRISLITALAPISYTSHIIGMLKLVTPFLTSLPLGLIKSEFLPNSEILHNVTDQYCQEGTSTQVVCYSLLFSITGFDIEQQIQENLVRQLHHFPSGTSSKTIVHYAQMIESGRFCAFDYGEDGNLEYYQQTEPPAVNLTNVTPPIALYLAKNNDYLVQPGDYQMLVNELPNIVYKHMVDYEKWNHMDSLVAKDAHTLVYPYIFEQMEQYKS